MDVTPLAKLPRPRPIVSRVPTQGISRLPTGPRLYSGEPLRLGAGAGEPPPGFVRATTSASEWVLYVAFAKVLKDPENPRQPPYFGGVTWAYQLPLLGTFTRELGSAVADYVIYRPRSDKKIIVRLQTRFFHEGHGPVTQGYDVLQRALLETQGDVIDVFEGSYMDADPAVKDKLSSNSVLQAACGVAHDTLNLIERLSPIVAGTSQARG